MSEFAQFVAFHQTGPLILPDPDTGQHEAHIRQLTFPNLDPGRTAVLLHQMVIDGGMEHLEMRFNDHQPFAVYDHLPEFPSFLSWHQIIQGDHLKADDNELVVVFNGQAHVRLQLLNFVLFYHATTPE